jgi:hypothetical protein
MIVDKVSTNSQFFRERGGGDTGWERVEHRSCQQLKFTHTVTAGQKRLSLCFSKLRCAQSAFALVYHRGVPT